MVVRALVTHDTALLIHIRRFHQLYEKNLTSTIHVTQAYFCKQTAESLGGRNFPKVTKYPLNNPNPMEPNGCHLDRIVECRSVVDKRSLCIVHMGELDGERKLVVTEQKDDKLPSQNDTTYMKLFLRRRDLSVAYREGFSTKYTCRECGKLFFSIDGLKYHCRTNACTKQAKAKKEEAAMRLEYIDSRANRLAKGLEQLQTGVEPSSSTSVHSKTSTSRRPQSNGFKSERRQSSKPDVFAPPKPKGIKPLWRKSTPKRERDAIYPQVWKALGFKIVPSSKKEPRVSMFGDTRKKKRKDLSNIHQQSTPSFRLIDVEHPSALDSEYDRLKAELEKVQSEKLGPMYPEVYTFLKFGALGEAFDQVPKPEPEPKEQDPFVPRPPAYNFPPAIIDVDVLAGEIDSGRYPSMKRNKNNDADAHEDVCYICRDPRGLLYMCDFCPRVNHLECIRSRFIIKDPEPQCDFMCNKCIQTISWRRRRAEKRRLKKQGLAEKQEEGATVDPAQVSAEMQADELVEEGKELEFIQKRAGNVDEIMLLLKDSRLRLKQLVETTKINDFRRKQLID